MRNWQITVLMLVTSAVLVRTLSHRKIQVDLKDCKSNLKNIAIACEMYCTDNQGRYPHNLDQLVPQYLTARPHCPGALNEEGRYGYVYRIQPDEFTLNCQAKFHPNTQPDSRFPEYHPFDNRCCIER